MDRMEDRRSNDNFVVRKAIISNVLSTILIFRHEQLLDDVSGETRVEDWVIGRDMRFSPFEEEQSCEVENYTNNEASCKGN